MCECLLVFCKEEEQNCKLILSYCLQGFHWQFVHFDLVKELYSFNRVNHLDLDWSFTIEHLVISTFTCLLFVLGSQGFSSCLLSMVTTMKNWKETATNTA